MMSGAWVPTTTTTFYSITTGFVTRCRGTFKKYLKIQIKLHWWLKDNIYNKNVPDVSVAITDLLQGK